MMINPTGQARKILIIAALVLIIAGEGFLAFRFFYNGRAKNSGTVEPSAVSTDVAAVSSRVTDSGCDSVPLKISRDTSFVAASVTRGGLKQPIGEFKLLNTTACPIEFGSLLFIIDSSSTKRIVDTVYLMANGISYGAAVSVGEGQNKIGFVSKYSTLTVPAFSTVTLAVFADVSSYAVAGQSFTLRLDSLVGKNTTTSEEYVWSYETSHMRVESNEMRIR